MQIETNNTLRFDSMADLHGHMTPATCHGESQNGKWFGNISSKEACNMMLTGDQTQVAAAQTMLDKFDVRIDTSGLAMDLGVAGFMPSVADYLGGSPESMYCMAETQGQAMPLKIIVNTVSSAGVSQDQLNRRGTVILAMVMALAAVRPITLEVITTLDASKAHHFNGNNYACARVSINTAPLDLGTACYALCHPGFTRHVLYGAVIDKYQSPGSWPSTGSKKMTDRNDPAVDAWFLDMLGETEESALFIPAIHLTDDLMTKPVEWIGAVLAKYSH